MRGHKYEIEIGGSRCADLTDKKFPQFISKANAQRQMSQGYRIVEYTAWLYREYGVCRVYELYSSTVSGAITNGENCTVQCLAKKRPTLNLGIE